MPHVLDTAEHFLTAVAPVVVTNSSLQPEAKPFLLKVDKALNASYLLNISSLTNCTWYKRAEMLDKAKVSDQFKDELFKSPLGDKTFSLPHNEVQKNLNQTPALILARK